MHGTVVHRWELPFREALSSSSHVQILLPTKRFIGFAATSIPTGICWPSITPTATRPTAMDWSRWTRTPSSCGPIPIGVHHDIDVGEDGTIYTLVQKLAAQPPAGLEFIDAPYMTDSLVVLSPEGQELQNIPLWRPSLNSPYALTCFSSNKFLSPFATDPSRAEADAPSGDESPPQPPEERSAPHQQRQGLEPAYAAKFPLFKAGQVLLSLRNLETLAVVDPTTRSVVWAAQGIWHAPARCRISG